jgi:colanic acid biosynthesis glycosyl transferase WcaI
MKILFLSQYFPPEMGAPAARVYELSREWVRLGCDVTVLTGFPNHPTGVIPPEYRGEWIRRETVDGIKVIRAPIYAAANKAVFKRAANYLSYSVSASVLGPWLTEDCDVVIATSPQILTGIAGALMSRYKRVPFVFDVRDLWPRSIVEVGALAADSLAVRALTQLELLLYKQADHIVVVTSSFVDEITAMGIPRSKLSVVTNGVDLDLFSPRPRGQARADLGLGDEFLVSYVGTHGMAHGLGTVLDAAKLLAEDHVRFILVGEGAEKQGLRERAQREQIENLTFWDQMPRTKVAQVVAASDLCLVMLRDLPLFKTVIPSKIFEFMGSERPILTTVDGESRRIVEDAHAGIYCPPENPQALAEAIRKARRDPAGLAAMGVAGRVQAQAKFSREALANEYLRVLKTL